MLFLYKKAIIFNFSRLIQISVNEKHFVITCVFVLCSCLSVPFDTYLNGLTEFCFLIKPSSDNNNNISKEQHTNRSSINR